jgi:hypothetical protein
MDGMIGMILQEISRPPALLVFPGINQQWTLTSVFMICIGRNVFYGEYKCTGDGANLADRVPYALKLSDVQALPYLTTSYIDGDQWLKPYCDSLVSPW